MFCNSCGTNVVPVAVNVAACPACDLIHILP